MAQFFSPGLLDRLMDERAGAVPAAAAPALSLEQLKDSVARDLEALLNTRAGLPEGLLACYPESAASVLNYGLLDFAGMCLSSSVDRERICASLKEAIERHEPRLHAVSARLRAQAGSINRVDFVIAALLKAHPAGEPVRFDAVLQPSTQRYLIAHSGGVA